MTIFSQKKNIFYRIRIGRENGTDSYINGENNFAVSNRIAGVFYRAGETGGCIRSQNTF